MLEVDIKRIDFNADNYFKGYHLDLDSDVQCVFLFSCKDAKFSELFYNKILDSFIDRIHAKNVYKDFSSALESLNAFLVNWKHEHTHPDSFSALIGIYCKNTFYFSNVGRAACYLLNSHKDIIEVTDKGDFPREFNFISSGELALWESIILSTSRILDLLSSDDIRDAFEFWGITQASDIIEGILLRESEGKNMVNIILQNKALLKNTSSFELLEKIQYLFFRLLDNHGVKLLLSHFYQLKNKISIQKKIVQQGAIGGGVLVITLLLFFSLSSFFKITSQSGSSEEMKEKLLQAQTFIVSASENVNDMDVFDYNIEQAEKIMDEIESEDLFLGDIQKLKNDISLLEKRMNGIELFDITGSGVMGNFSQEIAPVAFLDLFWKKYVVGKKEVVGPILPGESLQVRSFDKMESSDEFVAATQIDNAGILITKTGKVVQFLSSGTFTYQNVIGQDTWPNSSVMDAFWQNLYLLSSSGNQVEMYKRQGTNFQAGLGYLSQADSENIGKIQDIAVDGGVYILKSDGSIVKLFKAPNYRLESLVLNKLPKNYDFSQLPGHADIFAAANLNYVYVRLEDRILIFKPNSTRYQDTKSLTYLGQIEGNNVSIKSFFVENDGEIYFADEKGAYKVKFEASEKDGIRIVN